MDVLDGYDKHVLVDPIMVKLTKKFEMATQMVIMNALSSSSYQVNIVSLSKPQLGILHIVNTFSVFLLL